MEAWSRGAPDVSRSAPTIAPVGVLNRVLYFAHAASRAAAASRRILVVGVIAVSPLMGNELLERHAVGRGGGVIVDVHLGRVIAVRWIGDGLLDADNQVGLVYEPGPGGHEVVERDLPFV